jgi:heme/copper-type cytochrome/quinol oxidase subunit 2
MKNRTFVLLILTLSLFIAIIVLAISAVWIADYNNVSGPGYYVSQGIIGLSDKLNSTALVLAIPMAICFILALFSEKILELE